MGDDSSRLNFFRSFIKFMRKKDPEFGVGCYIDSTSLPNEIVDNPFNALCSHGVDGVSMQTRLVLILDEKTGLPVWYSIIPGNVLDINTIDTVLSDVAENLDVRIDNLVLDAGYASKALFNNFYSDEYKGKNFTVKMPARRVFPYKELYHQNKKLFSNAKYDFVREKKLKSVE